MCVCVFVFLRVCREDWKPVLTINSIIYGLQYLFLVSRFLLLIRAGHVTGMLIPFTPFFLPTRSRTPRTP